MAPKGKSSASSATRKKHARKAAATEGTIDSIPREKKAKGKDKKNKEPRKKVYIPPTKPAPAQPDPLDVLGIAQKLPPELLVVLRRLAKKDSTTKRRALEDFQASWVDKARGESADSEVLSVLADTVPVWLHHVPTLFLHPSRRIRLLAAGLHSSLLHLPSMVTESFFYHLREVASSDQTEHVLGAWCIAAYDVDRQVSSLARESWTRSVSLPTSSPRTAVFSKIVLDIKFFPHVWEFIHGILLDPIGIYLSVNPPQAAAPLPPHAQQRKGQGRPSPIKRDKEEDIGSRAKAEGDEENELDRAARLRIGAFGAAEWVLNGFAGHERAMLTEELLVPFTNRALWSALSHAQTPPFVQLDRSGFGYAQPGVRKAAWSLLQTLLKTFKDRFAALLPMLSKAVLRSAWTEPDSNVRSVMWQPLLTLLREFPSTWELETRPEEDEEEGDESEDSDDEKAVRKKASILPNAEDSHGTVRSSQAYREFLQFLELGCAGAPLQGYPAVLVVLSTIPSSILVATSSSPLQDLFESFWAALDGRALSSLDRSAASAAFISALLECLVFMTRRSLSGPPAEGAKLISGNSCGHGPEDRTDEEWRKNAAMEFVRRHVSRTWEDLSTNRLKVEDKAAAAIIVKNLTALNTLDPVLFRTAWDTLASRIRIQVIVPNATVSSLVSTFLKTMQSSFEANDMLAAAARQLTAEVVQDTIRQCEKMLESGEPPDTTRLEALVGILDTFGKVLFSSPEIAEDIDSTIRRHISRLLEISPSLLLVYLSHRGDAHHCSQAWQDVLRAVATQSSDVSNVLSSLLEFAEKRLLPDYLRPETASLDDVAGILLAEALAGTKSTKETALMKRLLVLPDSFISTGCLQALGNSLCSSFILQFAGALQDEHTSLDEFDTCLDLIDVLSSNQPTVLFSKDVAMALIPDTFLFVQLLPLYRTVNEHHWSVMKRLWDRWLVHASADLRGSIFAVIKNKLKELLLDCSVQPLPSMMVQLLAADHLGLDLDSLSDIFPARSDLSDMLEGLPSTPADSSLEVVDPLVPPPCICEPVPHTNGRYDRSGLSSYARVVYAALLHLTEERHTAKANAWILRHFLALLLYADELVQIPSTQSPVFFHNVPRVILDDIIAKGQQMTAYILSSIQEEENWHASVLNAILADKALDTLDDVGKLVSDLIQGAKRNDTVRESRILQKVLQHALSSASVQESDQWIRLARKLETQAPHTSLAITVSVTRHAPELPILDRYRNELAAGILGVPAEKANVEGLWLLRRLSATAPDPDSDVVFLQQLRAVNLMKACQQWIISDEELDEAVESEMTHVFFHLAPILQNVPGAHWELIFDMMENNLENSSLAESSTLVMLSRTLRLCIAIEDLASTNRALRAVWEERRTACLTLIRDLVAAKLGAERTSAPLSVCRKLALLIVQDLPESLLDETTLPKMCHIITDSSTDVRTMAHQLLHEAARKYTEHMVIETAVESEVTVKPELPAELITILQWNLNYEDGVEVHRRQEPSGYFLAWMLAFDCFSHASLTVKAGYTDQLRDLDLVGGHLLPSILSLLGLYDGLAKTFKLDVWAIDEYYLEYYSADSPTSLRLLAAHVYYRALLVVPGLVRAWLSECRDRQLFSAVSAYTASHFSPVIIKTELARLKDANAGGDLADESFAVKVANAINQVVGTYAVDEHWLEIAVKLPADYPLRMIEVIDLKRVGVSEKRWRAWLLGVQQIISYRSGSIADGLGFFKKNVASHFAGLTECAICYSILSAMDGSLPRMPCRTCKNRFHAGCLFQWFESSHSSSCPLCRSEIM